MPVGVPKTSVTNDFIFGKKITVTLILCICLCIKSTYCLCSKVSRDNQVMNTSISVAFLEANCAKLPVYKGTNQERVIS